MERLPNTQVLRYGYRTGWGLPCSNRLAISRIPDRAFGGSRKADDETATQLLKEARKPKGDSSPAEAEDGSGGSPAQLDPNYFDAD